MTVKVADTDMHVQRLVSVVQSVTMLEDCTTKEQCSLVRFLWAKGLDAKDINKKRNRITVGSVCRVTFQNWVEKFPRIFKSGR
jgi:hypothetical protein